MTFHTPSFPRLLRQGSTGQDVRVLQEILILEGHAVTADATFGPRTLGAVRDFQRARGLEVDGVVGPLTAAALVAPFEAACLPPAGPPPATFREAVALVAEHLLQFRIRELGTNEGPWVRVMMDGWDGPDALWCGGLVRHVLRLAAAWMGVQAPIEVSTGCDITARRARALGRLVPASEVQRGDITLRRGAKLGDWTHIEVVTAREGDRVRIVAGNTTSGGSRNGVAVDRHTHGLDGYDGVSLG